MAIADPGTKRLIRNPDSKNRLYIPQDRFPLRFHVGSGSVELANDGTYDIEPQNVQFVSGFYLDVNSETPTPEMAQVISGSAATSRYVVFYLPNSINNIVSGITLISYRNNSPYQSVSGTALEESTVGNYTMYSARISYAMSSNFDGLRIAVGMFQDNSRYTNVRMGLFFTNSPSSITWESAYMKAPSYYTVTYHDPSGTHQDVTHSDVSVGAPTPTPPTWTRTGYTLTGWNPARASTVTANVTYSAVWTANTYQIEWVDPSGTNATVTNSATYGSTTPTPPTWTRPGYEFGSWIPRVSLTVTKTQQYMAQWATAGSGKLPVTLDRMRVWADANGYPAGTTLTDADRMVLTYEQLAELAGGTGNAMAADGSEYVTLEQFREWANESGGFSAWRLPGRQGEYGSASKRGFCTPPLLVRLERSHT